LKDDHAFGGAAAVSTRARNHPGQGDGGEHKLRGPAFPLLADPRPG